MRRYSLEEFSKMEIQNPLPEIVANITAKHTGVSVEEMRGKSKSHRIVVARLIYAAICRKIVYPQYYIPYYIRKDDATLQYWYDTHGDLYETDIAFALLSDKVQNEFNNKLKSLKDA